LALIIERVREPEPRHCETKMIAVKLGKHAHINRNIISPNSFSRSEWKVEKACGPTVQKRPAEVVVLAQPAVDAPLAVGGVADHRPGLSREVPSDLRACRCVSIFLDKNRRYIGKA
jgi:hypothetical protein